MTPTCPKKLYGYRFWPQPFFTTLNIIVSLTASCLLPLHPHPLPLSLTHSPNLSLSSLHSCLPFLSSSRPSIHLFISLSVCPSLSCDLSFLPPFHLLPLHIFFTFPSLHVVSLSLAQYLLPLFFLPIHSLHFLFS